MDLTFTHSFAVSIRSFRLPVLSYAMLLGITLLSFSASAQANFIPNLGVSRSMEITTDYRRPDGFSDLLARSGREDKLLLLSISSTGQAESQRLQRETLDNPHVVNFLNHGFLFFQARTGNQYAHSHQLSRRLGISGYPSLALINEKEEVLWQYQGYLSPQDLINHLAHFLPPTTPAFNADAMRIRPQTGIAGTADDSEEITISPNAIMIMDNLGQVSVPVPNPESLPDPASTEIQMADRPRPGTRPQTLFGLVIKTAKDLSEIQQTARRWKLVWKGDIWIQRMQNDSHRLILGSLENAIEARQNRRILRQHNRIRARIFSFIPEELGPSILKY